MSGKSKKTIQRGSFQRLLKIFFLKNKMLTFLMLFSIVVSAIATALGPQYLGYATDSVVQDMQNPVSSNIHWDRFFYWYSSFPSGFPAGSPHGLFRIRQESFAVRWKISSGRCR